MSIDLISETEARRQWSGDMLVVRAYRDLKSDFTLYGCRALAAVFITLPFWASDVPGLSKVPFFIAFIIAATLLGFGQLISREIKAARHSSSWLFAASRDRVWVHFRSHHHYKWPRTDPTVFVIEASVVQSFFGVRVAGTDGQMAIRLTGMVPPELVDALLDENTRLEGEGMVRGRRAHEPVRIEESGQTLRLLFDNTQPGLGQALDKLRLWYQVDPPRNLSNPEAHLVPNLLPLNDAMVQIAFTLVKEGRKNEAMRYLRQRTGMGLKEAKDIVDDMSHDQA